MTIQPDDSRSTVSVDECGISHIRARDVSSAFFAQGWVASQDRIWQMEFDRLRAMGRWSEVVGFLGAKEDAFLRRLGLAESARQDWHKLDAATREMTTAYADGVNDWLESHRGALPEEFAHHPFEPEPWEPWHCVAVYKVRHVFMGTVFRKLWRGAVTLAAGPDLARIMRGDPSSAAAMVAPDGPAIDLLEGANELLVSAARELAPLAATDGGSNSWAVHGSRTASGKPLLAGDPHRGIEFPNVYHQCHVACPEFDVIGLAFPGVPGFPHFGHNDDVAWCITHGMCDDTDLFVEHFGPDAADPEPDWSHELMTIRGEGPVEVQIGSTARGPVVLGDPGDGVALSMMWTGISGADSTFDALLPMLTARSCSELEEAVRPWVLPVNNMLTADVDGDISFHLRGRVVERPAANRWTPVAGDDEHAWAGLTDIPFEDLHSWRNPERGFLVTANNRTADHGPYISVDFAGSTRHDRIVELLEGLVSATPDDMSKIHLDVRSKVAHRFIGLLGRIGLVGSDQISQDAARLLGEWEFELSVDSVAATIYAVMRRRWAESVGERLGIAGVELAAPGWPRPLEASRMLYEGATELLLSDAWSLVPGLRTDEDLRKALEAALGETVVELTQRLGPDMAGWTWGRVHRMASPHPLASANSAARDLHPPLDGCPGDGDTVRCGTVIPETGERSAAGSVARYVFDLADWDNSGWVVPHGVSGVRGTDHDLDQREAWLEGSLKPMAYSPEAVGVITNRTYLIP